MADLNEFEGIEARLRRYRPTAPSPVVREALLSRAPDVGRALERRGLWRYAAAAVLLIALNLGTEWFMSSRTQVRAVGPAREPATTSRVSLVEALNGFTVRWGHLAVYWNRYPPRPPSWWRERERLVKELTQ